MRTTLVLLLVLVSTASVASASEVHPRLFATPARLDNIRAQVLVPGSHHQRAFAAMQARVDASDPWSLDA